MELDGRKEGSEDGLLKVLGVVKLWWFSREDVWCTESIDDQS